MPNRLDRKFLRGNGFILLAFPLLFSVVLFLTLDRALNFDEMLTMRVGWLLYSGWQSDFHFAMPYYAIHGGISHSIQDPLIVFSVSRLFSAVLVCCSLSWLSFSIFENPAHRLLFVAATLANIGFVTHAFELRYDVALLCIFLVSSGVFIKYELSRPVILGGLLCLMAAHHLKGVIYALALSGIFLAVLLKKREFSLLILLRFGMGFLAIAVSWVIISWMFGFLDEVIGFYTQFFEVSSSLVFSDKWSDFYLRIRKDYLWWCVIGLLAVIGALSRQGTAGVRWKLLVLLAIPLFFVCMHPHPWPYMVIFIVPFFAALSVFGLQELVERYNGKSKLVRTLIWGTPFFLLGIICLGGYLNLASSNWTAQMNQMRLAKDLIAYGSPVIDPAGFLYFSRPADPEWYTDSLVRQQVKHGQWQARMAVHATEADFAVESYRISWLPKAATDVLSQRFRRLCGAIFVAKDFQVPENFFCPDKEFRLNNYWN